VHSRCRFWLAAVPFGHTRLTAANDTRHALTEAVAGRCGAPTQRSDGHRAEARRLARSGTPGKAEGWRAPCVSLQGA